MSRFGLARFYCVRCLELVLGPEGRIPPGWTMARKSARLYCQDCKYWRRRSQYRPHSAQPGRQAVRGMGTEDSLVKMK
jgi:hypothetical protein